MQNSIIMWLPPLSLWRSTPPTLSQVFDEADEMLKADGFADDSVRLIKEIRKRNPRVRGEKGEWRGGLIGGGGGRGRFERR